MISQEEKNYLQIASSCSIALRSGLSSNIAEYLSKEWEVQREIDELERSLVIAEHESDLVRCRTVISPQNVAPHVLTSLATFR